VAIRVYSVAKTVADCFKFRHKVGLEVAIDALRKYCHDGHASREELWHYAQVCRVTEVMRPYLEHAAARTADERSSGRPATLNGGRS